MGRSEGQKTATERRWPRAVRPTLGILAIAAVAFFFFRERHLFLGFGHTLSRLVWLWLVLAFVAEMASTVPLAEAQRIVLAAGGVKIPRPQMILITLASNAISMSVPAGVAVAEGYAYRQYRRFRGTRAATAWGELASGAIAFAALAGIALAGAAVGSASVAVLLLPTLSVVFAGATGAAAVFRHPHVLVAWLEWIEGHVGRRLGGGVARVGARVREMAEGLRGVHPSVSTWAAAFVLSAANWFLDVVSLACSFLAVGGRVPWGAVLLAFAGTKVVSSIAITPGGIGIVEGGLVATFVAYGTPGAVAAAAVLVYRALTLLGLVGVGWVGAGVLAAEKRR